MSREHDDNTDEALAERARQGHIIALEQLLERHQGWVYNLAVRMVYSPDDAADVTQESLLKVTTRLSTFEGRSSFRTWLYRIVVNHVINMKKRPIEKMVTTFSNYGRELDAIPSLDPPSSDAGADVELLLKEAKVGCMTGMLLCLDREQRVVFVLGEVLGIPDTLAAEVLEIGRDNFRQRLSRARRDLYQFMDEKCGLVKRENPCRCARKTKGFMQLGIVDPKRLLFATGHRKRVAEVAPSRAAELDALESDYARLFQDHPYHAGLDAAELVRSVTASTAVRQLLDLDGNADQR